MTRTARHSISLALLVTGLALFANASTTAGLATIASDAGTDRAAPTVHADQEPCSGNLREAPTVRLVSTEQRPMTRDEPRTRTAIPPRGVAVVAGVLRRFSWCDVVECRRSSGAVLLRYANPPPDVEFA